MFLQSPPLFSANIHSLTLAFTFDPMNNALSPERGLSESVLAKNEDSETDRFLSSLKTI